MKFDRGLVGEDIFPAFSSCFKMLAVSLVSDLFVSLICFLKVCLDEITDELVVVTSG